MNSHMECCNYQAVQTRNQNLKFYALHCHPSHRRSLDFTYQFWHRYLCGSFHTLGKTILLLIFLTFIGSFFENQEIVCHPKRHKRENMAQTAMCCIGSSRLVLNYLARNDCRSSTFVYIQMWYGHITALTLPLQLQEFTGPEFSEVVNKLERHSN